ncbi:MAG: septum site-determining protein MinC [Janthinobacterium sp.]|jgi:septum site-determining protein MinC
MSKSPVKNPVEIKISTVVAISVILHTADGPALDAALKKMTGGVPDFFEDDLAVIDVGALQSDCASIDWNALIALLKTYRLNAVAVRNAAPPMEQSIIAHGLTIDSGTTARNEIPALEAPVAASEPAKVAEAALGAMIIDTPVRAGQRIYARGRDLIITAVVNNGAEVIADGSIHVYGVLKGRALAGASGDASARIFALSMQPELVSIAGVYRTFEDGFPPELARQSAQISLVGDRIDILSIHLATRS